MQRSDHNIIRHYFKAANAGFRAFLRGQAVAPAMASSFREGRRMTDMSRSSLDVRGESFVEAWGLDKYPEFRDDRRTH